MDIVDTPNKNEFLAYRQRALDDSPSCAIIVGLRGLIEYANDAAQEVMGIGPYVGGPFAAYFSDHQSKENDAFFDALFESIFSKGELIEGRYAFVSPDGTRRVFFVTCTVMAIEGDDAHLIINCADVTAEEDARRMRRESTNVLLASIVGLCGYAFLYALWDAMGHPIPHAMMTNLVEVGAVIFGIFVYRNTSLGLDGMGLSTKNLKHNLKVDLIASAGIVAFWVVLKLVLLRVAPGVIPHPEPFIYPKWLSLARIADYAFTALVQEFLSRGILQESLLHILDGPRVRGVAIVVSTLMFTTLHLHYGPAFMAGAALMLSVFGIVYDRQRSIWGLAIIHFFFGGTAFMLGLT